MIVTGNRIYNNYELIPWHVTSPLQITDGEGIIIDTNQNASISGSGITYPAYTGRTLIANNVIYNNGNSAVEIFQSSHVDVVNNSGYGNVHTSGTTGYATPTGRGELALATAADVNVYNNIWYSYNSQNPVVQTICVSCTSAYNLFYNGTNTGYTNDRTIITAIRSSWMPPIRIWRMSVWFSCSEAPASTPARLRSRRARTSSVSPGRRATATTRERMSDSRDKAQQEAIKMMKRLEGQGMPLRAIASSVAVQGVSRMPEARRY